MNLISELRKSTKITFIVCLCFLLLTAVVLLYFMMFPIEPDGQSASLTAPSAETTAPVETTAAPEDWVNTEAPHTLSEWSASVDGYTRFTGEYHPYVPPTEDETEEASETEYEETGDTSETEASEETTADTIGEETTLDSPESSEYDHSETQTITETVQQPTEPQPAETTNPPEPTETEAVVIPGFDVE